jgi:hypothetical protein
MYFSAPLRTKYSFILSDHSYQFESVKISSFNMLSLGTPPCFISEIASLFLPGFSCLCILFPGYNIHVITISVLK